MSNRNLQISLLLLRVTVFLVMLVWTVDKFVNPGHAAGIFESFYGIGGVGTGIVWVLGVVELLILLAFVAGYARFWTYGFVMVVHGLTTLVSFPQYFAPFEGANILFFAAWPMWAACITLFLLRDSDRLLTINR